MEAVSEEVACRERLEWRPGELWINSSYSPLERLASAIFSGRIDPRERLMGMFTAYFDASGNSVDQPYVIVSGYLANYGQWLNFDKEWKQIHNFGVDLPFHMADFVAATTSPKYKAQKNARTDYVELAKDPERSDIFLKSLSQCEVTNVLCGFSSIVEMSIYESVSSLLELREVVPPYALGVQMCLERLNQWKEYFAVHDDIECIFDSGDLDQSRLIQLMMDERKNPPIFKKSIDFPGLQGADHYAWEQQNALKKFNRFQSGFQARKVFNLLISGIPKRHTKPDLANLIRLCEMKGIDPRTGIKK